MSNDKPLRYEDQQALIEENARLMRENERLKKSKEVKVKVKKPWKHKEFVRDIFLDRRGDIRLGWGITMLIGGFGLAIGSVVFFGVRCDNKNAAERVAPIVCYTIKSGDETELSGNDWEGDMYVYSVRSGRNHNWEKRIDSAKFPNKEQAVDFLSNHNLKLCN